MVQKKTKMAQGKNAKFNTFLMALRKPMGDITVGCQLVGH